jgi:para-aminobenzoate synthetase component 1
MLYTRDQAIEIMNLWGARQIPFFFIIDFEMKAIQLFRLNEPLPDGIMYDFKGKPFSGNRKDFLFRKFSVPFAQYKKAFDDVVKQIHIGNSFLTNLTFQTPIETDLSLQEIYLYSSAKYKLLVNETFVCFSPETFVKINNGIISTYPMKGTRKVLTSESEQQLLDDRKEIAEHHTIVDLLRNDLSIVATDVTVKRFRYIDKISTNLGDLLQVSSEISGRLPENYPSSIGSIIFAMLPAGSVTGAPKKKTLDIIHTVEDKERGYYTGISGVFDGINLDSAVLIRFIEQQNGKMFFRSGGGITFQSNDANEYKELIDKVYVPIG